MKYINYIATHWEDIIAGLGSLHMIYIHGSEFAAKQFKEFLGFMKEQGGLNTIKSVIMGPKINVQVAEQKQEIKQ